MTTLAAILDYFSRRIIDVSKILLAADGWHQKEKTSVGNTNEGDMGMDDFGADGGLGGRSSAGRRRGGAGNGANEASLTELVLYSVQPDAWRGRSEFGLATCTPFCGRLVINGPEQLLDDVEDFLGEIEASLSTE